MKANYFFDYLNNNFLQKEIQKRKILEEVFSLAQNLENQLFWIPHLTNGMDTITEFFQITSTAQDEFITVIKPKMESLKFQKEKNKRFLLKFEEFLNKTGRSFNEGSWNKTKIGEIIFPTIIEINLPSPWNKLFPTRNVAQHQARRSNSKNKVSRTLRRIIKDECKGKFNETESIEIDFVNPFMKESYKSLQKILKKFKEK